ncbi:hypothetical protein VNO78_17502 [Psophocarpus tetragonolobus]|uniref:Uncharacterized protein n=1 Tax=Psophocarpus tetragonolobus TaxID=3891 RepID=A0AAN9SJ34_PSOTE
MIRIDGDLSLSVIPLASSGPRDGYSKRTSAEQKHHHSVISRIQSGNSLMALIAAKWGGNMSSLWRTKHVSGFVSTTLSRLQCPLVEAK